MDNKQLINDNTARIEAITKRLNSASFTDVADTTATASDVATGKIFYDANGVRTEGVGNISEFGDMLQARVDATNSCDYLMYYYTGDNVDFLANLDTSNVTSMCNMFYSCSNLTTLSHLSQLDTSNVTNMAAMFERCKKITSSPKINTKKVTNMANMFRNCSNLTTLSQLDTNAVTNLNYFLEKCISLTEVPQLDTSNVTSMQYTFNGCTNLVTISLLDFIKMSSANNAFVGCTNLTNLTLKNIKVTLQIGSGTSWGHLLTDESLINTAKELWDMTDSTAQTLTVGSANLEKLASVYVKLVDITDEMRAEDEYIDNKLPFEVCESTDEGAMTINDYVFLKNWEIK